MLLAETAIERAYGPPDGNKPEIQGEWKSKLLTFEFKRQFRPERVERDRDYYYVEYNFGDRSRWAFEIEPERVTIERV